MTYFYARVSSRDQNLDRQIEAAKATLPELLIENIYSDKQSGKDFDRPAYKDLIGDLMDGDILAVKSIDRLGRNYDEILEQWRIITKEIGADVVVLDMPLLDTRNRNDLTGTLIADIVLQLLSYVAQSERESIQQRREEGVAIARAKGVKFGRPCREIPDFEKIAKKQKDGLLTVTQACVELGISRTQWYRMMKQSA